MVLSEISQIVDIPCRAEHVAQVQVDEPEDDNEEGTTRELTEEEIRELNLDIDSHGKSDAEVDIEEDTMRELTEEERREINQDAESGSEGHNLPSLRGDSPMLNSGLKEGQDDDDDDDREALLRTGLQVRRSMLDERDTSFPGLRSGPPRLFTQPLVIESTIPCPPASDPSSQP
jgi:hypothetical protein